MKVSVVIPVYNTEKYLNKCIESLLNQELKDIEIICVDDGSTDNSLRILNDFARKDKRVRILTQANQGQSVARNSGIMVAQGEYIGFLDSDDWADETMFEKLYKNAKQYDSDISMCSISVYDEKSGEVNLHDPYLTLDLFDESFENRAFNYTETLEFIFRVCVTPWNKIYKRKFLESKKLSFVENLIFEDNVFNLKTFVEADRISFVREPLVYYRRESETSCTFGSNDFKKLDLFRILELQEEFLKEKGLYEELKEYFSITKKNTLIYWYKKLTDEKVSKIYYEKLLSLYPDYKYTMDIVFSVDNNFVEQLATTIVSILSNSTKDEKFNFYVLDGGITDKNKIKINKLKSIKDFSIEYIEVKDEDFRSCPIPDFSHFTKATYYRFKLPSLLNLDKVLYLDCDILVKKSLRALYEKNLENKYALVAEDMMFSIGAMDERCNTLEIEKYFNAGVMLLNLKMLREDNIEKKCFEFIRKTPEKIKWVDQCVLNSLFNGKVKFVDKKFNFQYHGLLEPVKQLYKSIKKDIIILHFAGENKPWSITARNVLRSDYWYYALKTPYKKEIFKIGFDLLKYFIFFNPLRKLSLSIKLLK